MTVNIHATCVELNGQGVLLLGASGAGKSDLALRLITNHNGKLIADDRVDITAVSGEIFAEVPAILKNLLEVRGIGIINIEAKEQTKVVLAVELTQEKQPRLPDENFYAIEGVKLPLLRLNPFEASAPAKLLAGLSLLCGFKK